MDHKEGAKLQQTEGEIWVKGKALGKREPGEQEHRIVLGMACTGQGAGGCPSWKPWMIYLAIRDSE